MFLLPIVLIHGFSPLVSQGQVVAKGDTLAKRTSVSAYRINIAQVLGISLRRVKSCLRVHPGDKVRKGDLLAQKSGVLGLTGENIVSEVDGVVHHFEPTTGELVIQIDVVEAPSQQVLISPIDGVVSICDNEKIVIQTDSPVIVARDGSGHIGSGELHVMTPLHTQELKYFEIDATAIGKVLLGGQVAKDTLVKAMGMNVRGIITAHIAQEDLSYIQQKYAFPIVVVHENDYLSLSQHGGKQIYIDGLSKSIVL